MDAKKTRDSIDLVESPKNIEVSPNNLGRLDRKIDDLITKTVDLVCRVVRIEALHESHTKSADRTDVEMRMLTEHVTGLRVRTGIIGAFGGIVGAIATTLIMRGLTNGGP